MFQRVEKTLLAAADQRPNDVLGSHERILSDFAINILLMKISTKDLQMR